MLTEKQKNFGLWLSPAPSDPDLINLIYKGRCVGSWGKFNIREKEVQEAAQEVMELEK